MKDLKFIGDYLNRYKKSLFETDISDQLIKMKKMLLEVKNMVEKSSSPETAVVQQ